MGKKFSSNKNIIKMGHGAGGSLMQGLIHDVILKYLGDQDPAVYPSLKSKNNVPLNALEDGSIIGDIVFTTDGHTVKPLFFPGGDIGSLSVAGTVNDLCVMGAQPLGLSLSLIIEEGFPIDELERIIASVEKECKFAGVPIITGDTKVVEKGGVDGLVINTSGIGKRSPFMDTNIEIVKKFRELDSPWMLDSNLKSGDLIILSGTVGDHGISILSRREGYSFQGDIQSDVRALNHLIENALETGGVVSMKDPTRGGIANALNEMAEKSNAGILVKEDAVPINPGVKSATEMLGLDPLEIGNEGKVIIVAVPEMADKILEAIRKKDEGKDAAIIGEVKGDFQGVLLETVVGGKRYIEPPVGDPIPRIC